MNRRRFLATVSGGIAALAGCSSDEPSGSAGPGTDTSPVASPGTIHAGPTVTARPPDPSTGPSATPAAVVTSTGPVTFTPTVTATTASDAGGSSGGGGGSTGGGSGGGSSGGGGTGGSGAADPADTATPTPTESAPSSPLQLTLSTMTMQHVAGELTCTAGPLAWMALEVGFLRAGEPVASEHRRREEPGTGDAIAFDVASDEADLDGVRLTTSYAHPEG